MPLGFALVALLLVGKYGEVMRTLRYLMLGFLAFGAVAFLAHPDWPLVLRNSVIPTPPLNRAVVAGALALIGTTLTSYVYIWETIERGVEEMPSGATLGGARIGAVIGAIFTAVVLWFVLVSSAATLGQRHKTVTSAQEAAHALRPLAGSGSAYVFAVGLIVSAVVALPVLMATTAYVVGAHFKWRRGPSEPVSRARDFYGVLAASIGLAFAVTLANVSVIGMLVIASVIGGLGTPIGLILLMLARDGQVMGARPISSHLAIAGWAVAIGVGGLGLLYVVGAALGKL
jgi:Mn2+/Fe2+ NRAMP family transporter